MKMDNKEMKRLRIINGMTQTDMAEFIGVSMNTYVNWELGLNAPSELNEYRIEQAIKKLKEK
jgi:DNA-binding XRE family transcriptional regulator